MEIVSHGGLDGIGAVARLNDASPCGDMMYLLRKYDVARFTRNEAMFAKNVAKPHIIIVPCCFQVNNSYGA